ncbi:MAG TPA: methionyl-tRNA formyltransferase [Dehalococcoidia bacterium]|nr:methionyl-tRNA formyltransferase [Dehalococcoidia bacterium]
MKVPLVFMGTPEFAVPSLQRLVVDGYDISAVYTQPDRPAGRGRRLTPPPVKVAALGLGLAVRQPPNLRSQEAVAELAALKPEVIVVCAFGQILRPPVLDIPPRGVINVHPSLLPRWRGASPIAAAILAGDDVTGVTTMLMDPGMDTGPILGQRSLSIEDRDSAASLGERLARLAADLLSETLPQLFEGNLTPQPQDGGQATYCPVLRKEEGAIDWGLQAVDIWRRVRALNPWPGTFTHYRGEVLHIWEAWPLSEEPEGLQARAGRTSGEAESQGGVTFGEPRERPVPGTVSALTQSQEERLLGALARATGTAGPGMGPVVGAKGLAPLLQAFGVQTGEGVLAVLQVQRAGRRAITAAEFLRGERGLLGTVLGRP